MEDGTETSVELGPSRREALVGLLLVQLAVGYEWFASGLSKLIRGDFPGGLADELREKSEGAAGWYRSFLDGAVIPHSRAFGYLIEIGELVTGVALMGAALAWLLAGRRLRRRGSAAVLLATAAAAVAGIVMAVNFHLASGGSQPWALPSESFDEAVDLDSLIVALHLVFLGVSVRLLLSLKDAGSAERGRSSAADPGVITAQRRQGRRSRKEMIVVTTFANTKRAALLALASLGVGLALGAALLDGNRASAAPAKADPQLSTFRQEARFFEQLTSVLKPAPAHLRSMQDHRLYMLPSGIIVGLHFDNMKLAKAKNLNWVVFGVPGVFTKADQARVSKEYGPGFVHFHDFAADAHGGKPGAKGFWFVHVGARNFTSMFGKVTTGTIDPRMMPTPPPR
jgi:hypothetical protein